MYIYIYIHTPFINPEWKISFSSKLLQVGTCDDQFLDTVYGDGVPDVHLYFFSSKTRRDMELDTTVCFTCGLRVSSPVQRIWSSMKKFLAGLKRIT